MDPNPVLHWTDHAGERQAMPLSKLQEEFKAFLAWRPQQATTVGAPLDYVQRGWLIEWPIPGGKRGTVWSDSDAAAKAIGCPHEPVFAARPASAVAATPPAVQAQREMENALRSLLRHAERVNEVLAQECGVRFVDDGPLGMARDALRAHGIGAAAQGGE